MSCSPRQFVGVVRQETVVDELSAVLGGVKAHGFQVVNLEPQLKDGGIFVKFKYSAGDPDAAIDTILQELRSTAEKHGGMPSWWGGNSGGVWFVKGKPWKEVSITSLFPTHI